MMNSAQKRYQQSDKFKKTRKRYRQTEKYKACQKRYWQGKKGKANRKRTLSRHPKHWKATNAVNYAIRIDKLPRPDTLKCSYCPAQAEHYHHNQGYEFEHWLDVLPACQKCHNKIHRKSA